MPEKVRVTYATMSADNEDLHADYERGLQTARSWLGQKHQFYVNGEAREGEGYDEERSPIDRDVVIGYFAKATRQDTRGPSSRITIFKRSSPDFPARPAKPTRNFFPACREGRNRSVLTELGMNQLFPGWFL